MSKKMLYVAFVDKEDAKNLGVARKVDGQIKAFKVKGYEVDEVVITNKTVHFNRNALINIGSRFNFYLKLPLKLYIHMKKVNTEFDLIYIRKAFFTPLYFMWFNLLYRRSKAIIFELPTYPFKKEIKGRKLPLLLDDIATYLLKKKIYRIVTTQGYNRIYGIDTINIRNGYDFSGIDDIVREPAKDVVRFITVANLSFWHGVERMLYGIAEYNKKQNAKKVEFHIVGAGEELDALVELKRKLNLDEVIFHGPKSGNELDKLYKNAHIGVGTLGLYKKKATFHSSLKNMEYCFYGLPFIIGNEDVDLKTCNFVMQVPNDTSPVNIENIIEWFYNLTTTPHEIQRKGIELYSWDRQIEIILDALKMSVK